MFLRMMGNQGRAAGSGDQPEPSCHGPEKNGAGSHDTEHDGAKQQGGGKRFVWVGREHSSV